MTDWTGSAGIFSPVDEIARAVLDAGVARVVAAVTTSTAREAARRHQAGPAGALALARGATAGLLLATLTKDDERVSLQVLGDGPLGGLTVDARASGGVRAYVKNPDAGPHPGAAVRLGPALGSCGVVSVLRDLGLRENFSGQTSIISGELDLDVEHYLNTSEQIDSALACEVLFDGADASSIVASAGILIQALPGSSGGPLLEMARHVLREGALGRALAAGRAAVTAEAIARAVMADLGRPPEALQILDVRPAQFECPCSRARAGSSLALLGSAELASMIVEDGKAEVTCNFCRERYDFTEAELEAIRREAAGPSGPPS